MSGKYSNDPFMKMLSKEIGFYGDYGKILEYLITTYDEKMSKEKQSIAKKTLELTRKKNDLNQLSHQNLEIASEVTKLRAILDHYEAKGRTDRSANINEEPSPIRPRNETVQKEDRLAIEELKSSLNSINQLTNDILKQRKSST